MKKRDRRDFAPDLSQNEPRALIRRDLLLTQVQRALVCPWEVPIG